MSHKDTKGVRVFFLELKQERVCHGAVKTIDTQEMKTVPRERSNSRKEVAVFERLLAVDDGALPTLDQLLLKFEMSP